MSAPAGKQSIEWEEANGVNIVRFATPSLRDDRLIRTIFEQIDQLLIDTGRRKLILNFSGVEAFASYTIGKLVALNKNLQTPTSRLALCCLTASVNEIIDIMRLRKQFNIYPTEQTALDSFV
jgi:anti-sigma B factor antagonist